MLLVVLHYLKMYTLFIRSDIVCVCEHCFQHKFNKVSTASSGYSTLADTCMLLSCIVMIASEILMSIGCITASILEGPCSLSATSSMASVKTQRTHVSLEIFNTNGLVLHYE